MPRIFQRIYEGINNKLKNEPLLVRKIFDIGMKIKIKDYNQTGILKNILLDNIIFRRVRASFGGKLRFMLVGSAPVEPEILNFLRCALSCEIVEGYGQTEDIAGVLLTRTIDPVTQHLGGPGFSCEIKLRDVPELGYTSKTLDEKGNPRPSGELMVKGPIVFKGYFRDKEKTEETINEEGWMHSGDIATIIPEHGNAVKIVDRVKNIFKLQQGEYISPEKIENILSGDKYVDQIFIYGDTLQNYLIAFIYPSKGALINLLQSKFNDININETFEDLVEKIDSVYSKLGTNGATNNKLLKGKNKIGCCH